MRLERIGEGSALIARIEAINAAAFPEIERISIKNFLKMSRKGQLEIAAIFEDFTALVAGGAADKHYAAASENLCVGSQDRGEANQNRSAAGKNYDADNCGAAEFASLNSKNRSVIGKKSNATCEKSSLESKNPSAEAQNLSGEELVGFCVYRTEQTYKRAVLRHKQLPPRLNADKILRSKAHSGAEFDGAEDEISGGEISSIAIEGKISSGTAESEILRYDESEIPSGGESEIFYVAYLGIDAKFRGLGIGSRLLALIVTQNPRAQIVLDVEPPHEDAPNLAQRLRRIEFYGRHGFRRCGKFFNYAGLSFEILAKPPLTAPQQEFDVASFVKFTGAGNKFRFKITDAPLYKN